MLNCGRLCHHWASARETNLHPLPIFMTVDANDLHQDFASVCTVHYGKLLEALPTLGQCKRDQPASSAHLLDC